MRVLIADDQRTIGVVLADLVTRCGHEVVEVVSSGLEAVKAYARLHPDVVLMDYAMPRLNGATACRMILSRDPNARVILISGVIANDAIAESGAVAFLAKPINLEQLYAALYDAGTPPPTTR